jgi:hypothetical protein
MQLEQAHSQPPVNTSNSTAAINEHAPNAGSGHATAEIVAKNMPSAVAAPSKITASAAAAAAPVQTIDYGRKLFEIDNVCFPPFSAMLLMYLRRCHSRFRRVPPFIL